MIPVCLVTGFLGSGKTTLLRRIVRKNSGRRLVFLVNEFSPRDVDGGLVADDGAEVVTVPGGSIFCRCLVTGFLQHLRRIASWNDPSRGGGLGGEFALPVNRELRSDPRPREEGGVAGLVIEASGVANPAVIRRLLAETGLDREFRLSRIVVVVDPKSFPKLLRTLPNIRAQAEGADVVLVNKIDLAAPAELEKIRALLAEIAPQAEVIETSRCEAEFELFPAAGSAAAGGGEYAKCADPNFERLELAFSGPADLDALRSALLACGEDLYRAKGKVWASGGAAAYVDLSGGGVTLAATQTAAEGDGALALIARGGAGERVREILSRLPHANFQ